MGIKIENLENIGNLCLAATSTVATVYQSLLARSMRPQTTVTPDQADRATIGAFREIGALGLALDAINNLAGRHKLLDKGLHPGIYKEALGQEKEDDWLRYCYYHDDFQRHVHRLAHERQIAQTYYDASAIERTPALKKLIEIETTLNQILKGSNVTLGDVVQLTSESLIVASNGIREEFKAKVNIRRRRVPRVATYRKKEDPYGVKRPPRQAADRPSRPAGSPSKSPRGSLGSDPE